MACFYRLLPSFTAFSIAPNHCNFLAARLLSNKNGKSVSILTALVGVAGMQLDYGDPCSREAVIKNDSFRRIVSCEGNGANNKKGNNDDEDDFVTKLLNLVRKATDGDSFNLERIATVSGSKLEEIISTGVPGQLSGGFVAGFCAGYSLKKVGKFGAFAFGFGFCALQALSYSGYIKVNYNKIYDDVKNVFDLNNDGKVDENDGHRIYKKMMEILTYNIPAGSGFSAGFIAGARSG